MKHTIFLSTLFALNAGLLFDLGDSYYLRAEVLVQKTDYSASVGINQLSNLDYIATASLGLGYKF